MTLLHNFFDLTSFQRLGQKSWKKIVVFLEDLKTPKGHFEINRPLSKRQIWVGDFFKYIDYYWPSPKIFWPSAVPVKGVAHFSITLLTIFVSHYLNTLCAPKGFDEKKSKKPLSFFDTWRDGHANLNTRTKVIKYKSCGELFILVQSTTCRSCNLNFMKQNYIFTFLPLLLI